MKIPAYIMGVLFAAATAMGQSVSAPTDVSAQLSDNSTQITVKWTGPTVVGGHLTYKVFRKRMYPGPSGERIVQDSGQITESLYETQYIDRNVLSCYTYRYWVKAVVKNNLNVTRESPASDIVDVQIKGGVNAVVIFPTPKTVAVAGSPFTMQLSACDSRDNATITFSLVTAPQGMMINSASGVITWNVPDTITASTVKIRVRATDDVGSTRTADISILVDRLSGGQVYGKFVFPVRGPVPITVQLVTATPPFAITTLISQDDGTYKFDPVVKGSYALRYQANDPGQILRWYPGTTRQDSAQIIVVDEKPVKLPDITMTLTNKRLVVLSGRLTANNAGVGDAVIQAYEVSEFMHNQPDTIGGIAQAQVIPGPSAVTSADGTYALQVDSGGEYMILASADGFQSRFINGDSTGCASPFCASAVVARGDTTLPSTSLSHRDPAGSEVAGSVTSISDMTGVRAMIMLMRNSGGTITSGYSGGLVPFDVVTSDSAGNFMIPSVTRDTASASTYMIQAVPFGGYVPAYFTLTDPIENMLLWEHATAFTLDNTSIDPLAIDVHVQPVGGGIGALGGSVRQETKDGTIPSANAYVYAVDQTNMTAVNYAVTDPEGNFSIGNLPLGTYLLFADKIPFHAASVGEVLVRASDTAMNRGHSLLLTKGPSGVGDGLNQPTLSDLSPAFPNPFGHTTFMRVNATQGSTLKVFDVLGREMADLSAQIQAGGALVSFHANNMAPGMYICLLSDKHGVFRQPLIVTHR